MIDAEKLVNDMEKYGVRFHPTKPKTLLLNLDIAVVAAGLMNNEATKATIHQAYKAQADEEGLKLIIVKATTEGE